MIRLVCVFLAITSAAYAQRQMTAAQMVDFIASSVKMHQDDRQVADFVRKIKLTNRLDDRTVETLQGMGAGPRTILALHDLSAASASLPLPPPPAARPAPGAVIPPPDAIEQARVLAEVRENALNYTKNLPNFLCIQMTRRHWDPSGTENWSLQDTIQERLSYTDHKENYEVVMVNNRAVTTKHEALGGAKSSGEFGSMLFDIFDPASEAEFDWERWATLRGRRMHVFTYRISKARSRYSILHEPSARQIVSGYHGLVYADRDTGAVMRITMECDTIPPDFPIQQVREILDYDLTKISDQEFVLPLKVDLRSSEGRAMFWNEVEFHLYRKFGADTTITFDSVDAIPDDQLKEGPAKPEPQSPPPGKQR